MKYKVRITKNPVDNMAYGGQSGYGLDMGQRGRYDNMNESPFDSVSSTAGPVPRGSANIEAEKNETMVGDMDGDGRLEHMTIGGKPHSKGGTPLKVEPGTFIFSQTKKMAFGGPALQAFGKSGNKKYTPAELAKQYDLNKYKAVMENPEMQNDPIAQRTAHMMYENNSRKLGMLALIQEGMKGFPQGIPDIARSIMPMGDDEEQMPQAAYGGYFRGGGELPSYETKGQVTKPSRNKIDKSEFDKLDPNVWKIEGNKAVRTWDEKIKDGTPGTQGTPGFPEIKRANGKGTGPMTSGYENFIKQQLAKGITIEELAKKGYGNVVGLSKYKPFYIPAKPATPGIPATDPLFEKKSEELYYEEPIGPKPGTGTTYTPAGNTDYGRKPFFGNSLFLAPQRERYYSAPINAMVPEPTFYDPNRELAANAEQANITQQYLASMGSPQSFMANASATQGKALENAAAVNSRYQNLNVGVANQFAPAQAAIFNDTGARMQDRADKQFWNNEQGRKAYRNNMRQWMNNIDRYRENDYEVQSATNLLNQTNPYYDMVYGPRGASLKFRPGVDVNSLITGQYGKEDHGITEKDLAEYEKEALRLKSANIDPSIAKEILQARFKKMNGKASSGGSNFPDINNGYLQMLNQMKRRGSGQASAGEQ